MAESAMLHIRMDKETKEQAQKTFALMGFSMSDAVRIYLRRVIEEKAIPFEVRVPNARTQEAMREAEHMAQTYSGGSYKPRFTTEQEIFKDLDEKSR